MYPCAHCGQWIQVPPVQTPRGPMHAHCYSAAFPNVQPPPSKTNAIVPVLAVVGVVFVLGLVSSMLGAGSNAGTGSAHSEAPKAAAPPVQVTATVLFTDYQANEVAADEKYRGRTLLVSGSVASVAKDFTDDIVVNLSTPNQFMSAMATMKGSEKAATMKLVKGQAVKIRCQGGGMLIGRPVLRDCTVE